MASGDDYSLRVASCDAAHNVRLQSCPFEGTSYSQIFGRRHKHALGKIALWALKVKSKMRNASAVCWIAPQNASSIMVKTKHFSIFLSSLSGIFKKLAILNGSFRTLLGYQLRSSIKPSEVLLRASRLRYCLPRCFRIDRTLLSFSPALHDCAHLVRLPAV